jgi:hypothetical protein
LSRVRFSKRLGQCFFKSLVDEDPKQEDDDNVLDVISNRVEILVQKKLGSHTDDEFEAKLREARSRQYL